jgi:hypothetical protein
MDFNDNFKIVGVAEKPVLSPGEAGLFDDSGVSLGWLLSVSGKKHLYYLGWNLNLKVTVPWQNAIGLAVYDEAAARFVKTGRAPIVDRSEADPFTISYPCVIKDGSGYSMWYGSNLKWGRDQQDMCHVIKHARSADGISWNRSGHIAINLQYKNEYAVSKPMVLKEDGIYKMWYSYRGRDAITGYRIGYAESTDGHQWLRKDDLAGIDVSKAQRDDLLSLCV